MAKQHVGSTTPERGTWFARRSLTFKMAMGVALVTVVAMSGLTTFVVLENEKEAANSVEREMTASMAHYEQSLQMVFEGAIDRGKAMMPGYIEALGGEPKLGRWPVHTGEAGMAPSMVGATGEILSGKTELQQQIRRLTGADTAILVKHDGGWIRAATLLTDDKGERRIGSRLPDEDHLARTLNAGENHAGLVQRNGRWFAMTIHPLKDEKGETYGGLTVRVDVNDDVRRLLDAMVNSKVAQFGSVGIMDKQSDGWVYVAGPREGQKATERVNAFLAQANDGKGRGFMPYDLGGERGVNLIAWAEVPNWDWTIYASGPEREFMAEGRRQSWLLAIIMLGATALIVLVAGFIARRTLAPLGGVLEHLGHIEQGDLSDNIPATPAGSANEVHQLLGGLDKMQQGLAKMVLAMRSTAQEIHQGSGEIVSGNVDLSSRTEQQAASLEQTAASMDELSGTVRQTADNAKTAKELADTASVKASHGGQAVGEVVETMTGIEQSSSRIFEIVNVIDSIAFQTNILALNAAVEAARAGDQGRGFAVVASEVRALAQRSATAAKEIKGLIDESRSQVQVGAEQVNATRAVIEELVDSVQSVSGIMGEISNATNEQSVGISQVNQAVAQMDSVTQQNAALVEEAAAAAGSLEEQARVLTQLVASFKLR